MTQERILIADGNISLSEMLKNRLEAKGYRVDCAVSGKDALHFLQTEWIDLVILEIVLQGGINGFQLFKELKKKRQLSKIPVVIHSSKISMKKMFERLGAKAFFVKPYSVDLFLEEVKDILG